MIEEYQKRVVEEKIALDEKIKRLTAFINSDKFYALPAIEQTLLRRQDAAMAFYSLVLSDRIALFRMKCVK